MGSVLAIAPNFKPASMDGTIFNTKVKIWIDRHYEAVQAVSPRAYVTTLRYGTLYRIHTGANPVFFSLILRFVGIIKPSSQGYSHDN